MTEFVSPIKCLVVDDEPLALALLSEYIQRTPGLHLAGALSDTVKALNMARSGAIDLVFLDMQMPELSGLQFLKILQQRCLVIVTTAYGEYALEGYEHHVVDYLLKPVLFDRFLISVGKAQERLKTETSPPAAVPGATPANYIFVKTDNRSVRLELDDIYYLEGARDYVVIHARQDKLITSQSLRSLMEVLPAAQFMRVHKSYIVAVNKISFIERNRVVINEQYIPVSDSYKQQVDGLTRG